MAQVAKLQTAVEWRSVREMERIMDVELFLGIQGQWAEDSPHCMAIIHEMFQHAATEGQKEAEQIICQGCQQSLPQLNPEAGVPAVQLVGLETPKEELQELYLKVYKLHRLPGSPPGEPVLLEEVLSSLKDHKELEGGKGICSHSARPHPEDPHSLEKQHPPERKERQFSREKSGHWYVRPTKKHWPVVATLKEEIERLNHTQESP